MASVEMVISKLISGSSQDHVEFAPPAGEATKIRIFHAGGEFAYRATVRLYWKYGSEGETMIWAAAPGNHMPFVYTLSPSEVDGINKLAVVVENQSAEGLYMAGYALVESGGP